MTLDSDAELALSSALVAEIRAAAAEEQRPVVDVLGDAVAECRREQRWRRTLALGAERAAAPGLSAADVPRLIAAYREENRQGLPPA